MIEVRNEGIILEKTDNPFESKAVLNPCCVEVDGITKMFYRAVDQQGRSSIGYAELKDNKTIKRCDHPILFPENEYEKVGLEDPRIVYFEGVYYLFYTAFDGMSARVAYATSPDLITFTKKGVISTGTLYKDARIFFEKLPQKEKYLYYQAEAEYFHGPQAKVWDKDAFIFPKKINNRLALIHRIKPSIQISYFDSFNDLASEDYWIEQLKDLEKHTVLDPGPTDLFVGGGCPPIETKYGWLMIYHRVIGHEDRWQGQRIYSAGAMLLDLDDPQKITHRLSDPLFVPTEDWELRGDVDTVVFPTGAIVRNGRLYIYYGAADRLIACKSIDLQGLMDELKKS